MYCGNCGAQNEEGSVFCQSCGASLQAQAAQAAPAQNPNPGYAPNPNAGYAPNPNAGYGNQPYAAPGNGVQDSAAFALPMKWHSFLVYFALWAAAVYNLIQGFRVISGSHYGGEFNKALIYGYFKGLQTIDVFYGLALIGCAALGACTAFFLLKKKALGPTLLTVLYIVAAVAALIYCIAVTSVLSSAGAGSSASDLILTGVVQAIVSAAMIFINRTYYGKRKDLFVN